MSMPFKFFNLIITLYIFLNIILVLIVFVLLQHLSFLSRASLVVQMVKSLPAV